MMNTTIMATGENDKVVCLKMENSLGLLNPTFQ